MSIIKKNMYNVLRGSFLTDDDALKNWRIIILVIVLLLVIIYRSHQVDEKVIKISELNKKKRELRAAYIDVNTLLTRAKMESTIRKRVKKTGLGAAKTPPKKIQVIINMK